MAALPDRRTLALFALLIVGVVVSFAFHASVGGMEARYDATVVDDDTSPSTIASATPNVSDLDAELAGAPPEATEFVDRAVATGEATGNAPPELYMVVDDVHAPYAAYHGQLFRWTVTTADATTDVTIHMHPVSKMTVVADVARPYRTASPTVRAAIDQGSTRGDATRSGVFVHDDRYYLVEPTNRGAIVSRMLEGLVGYLFTPVGRGFVAVALGILAYRYREPTRARVLTPRRAVVVATLAIPVALAATLVFETGSLTRLIRQPASALVVSTGVVAGVYVHRRQWGRLVGVTLLAGAIPVVAGLVSLGFVGAVFGVVGSVVGLVTGTVSLVFGAAFAVDPSSESESAN